MVMMSLSSRSLFALHEPRTLHPHRSRTNIYRYYHRFHRHFCLHTALAKMSSDAAVVFERKEEEEEEEEVDNGAIACEAEEEIT